MKRREFLGTVGVGLMAAANRACGAPARKPNLVYVFADQWRAQAFGYAGDPNAVTPNLDRLAGQSVNFTHAVSGCPVCSPYRASLLTGQYWLTHGIFLNDVPLRDDAVSFAEALNGAGYGTAYIGKWHLDGRGRSSFIPPERRQGFGYWRVQECTHDYNHSQYYADSPEPRLWEGYDADAQTDDALAWMKGAAAEEKPFALFLSWGPPHNPYETAPERWKARFSPDTITLRPNVPEEMAERARKDLAGYYAHAGALDENMGRIMDYLDEAGLADDTILVFTSDHGDMLGSQGMERKQKPYDESIRVPFLLRWPAGLGKTGRALDTPLNTPDILPTLLGLAGAEIPAAAEGRDFSRALREGKRPDGDAALILCAHPFGEWIRTRGGREYRGVRTVRHTYVRSLDGPWLLYDNEADPYQQRNLCGMQEHRQVQEELDARLKQILAERNDAFLPGNEYVRQFGYTVDETGTVRYTP